MRWTRRLLFIVGLSLIGIYLSAHIHKEVLSRVQSKAFAGPRAEVPVETKEALAPESGLRVDVSQWSKKRIAEYEESLSHHLDPPLAVLRIPKVELEVPVLEGTDDLTLNRGVGHIVGTARPGEEGNIGIAGHRDGFFRALKDIGPGDTIELLTPRGITTYKVDQIVLVSPKDVSVLQPRPSGSVTLVTCYPFYFIGSAPQRYIVQASITNSDRTHIGGVRESSFQTSQR